MALFAKIVNVSLLSICTQCKNVGKFIYVPVNVWSVREQHSLYWQDRNSISFNLIQYFLASELFKSFEFLWESMQSVLS